MSKSSQWLVEEAAAMLATPRGARTANSPYWHDFYGRKPETTVSSADIKQEIWHHYALGMYSEEELLERDHFASWCESLSEALLNSQGMLLLGLYELKDGRYLSMQVDTTEITDEGQQICDQHFYVGDSIDEVINHGFDSFARNKYLDNVEEHKSHVIASQRMPDGSIEDIICW